jgi:archaemetzincin
MRRPACPACRIAFILECLGNGSHHLVETDAKPHYLCPVCLRKLHLATGFDAGQRYADRARFYRSHAWYDELDWVNRQLARVPSAQK